MKIVLLTMYMSYLNVEINLQKWLKIALILLK
jgi:hypothetical protein